MTKAKQGYKNLKQIHRKSVYLNDTPRLLTIK